MAAATAASYFVLHSSILNHAPSPMAQGLGPQTVSPTARTLYHTRTLPYHGDGAHICHPLHPAGLKTSHFIQQRPILQGETLCPTALTLAPWSHRIHLSPREKKRNPGGCDIRREPDMAGFKLSGDWKAIGTIGKLWTGSG